MDLDDEELEATRKWYGGNIKLSSYRIYLERFRKIKKY